MRQAEATEAVAEMTAAVYARDRAHPVKIAVGMTSAWLAWQDGQPCLDEVASDSATRKHRRITYREEVELGLFGCLDSGLL